ncbi:MAG: acyltransferase [Bacteroidota bacterium]
MQATRVKELDVLRGLAALMVMWYHFTAYRTQADLGFFYGTTGVELFFMISGFVIFMSLNHVETSKQFIVNRFSRLYPTYWICMSITFLMLFFYKHITIDQTQVSTFLGNLTMFQFYLKIKDIDDSYWTLIIEMTFYIAILALFRFKKLQYINGIALSLMIIATICGVFFSKNETIKTTLDMFQILQYIPLFLSGIIFYKLYFQPGKIIQNYGLLLTCLICQILSFTYSSRFSGSLSLTEYTVSLFIYFGLFICIIHRKLGFLVNPVTLFLGKISFALYLLHQAISTQILIPYFMEDLHFGFWTASFLLAMPIIIVMATLITYFIEAPLRKVIKQGLLPKDQAL